MTIITISNVEKKQYFFTNDHCQNHNLGKAWVPCTYTLPICVVQRPSCPKGIVDDEETLKKVFYDDYEEIDNPQKDNKPNK